MALGAKRTSGRTRTPECRSASRNALNWQAAVEALMLAAARGAAPGSGQRDDSNADFSESLADVADALNSVASQLSGFAHERRAVPTLLHFKFLEAAIHFGLTVVCRPSSGSHPSPRLATSVAPSLCNAVINSVILLAAGSALRYISGRKDC